MSRVGRARLFLAANVMLAGGLLLSPFPWLAFIALGVVLLAAALTTKPEAEA